METCWTPSASPWASLSQLSPPVLSAEKVHWSLPLCITFTLILSYIHINIFHAFSSESSSQWWNALKLTYSQHDKPQVSLEDVSILTLHVAHRDERQSGLMWAFGRWRGIRRLSLETEAGFNPALSPSARLIFTSLILLLSLSLCLSSPPVLSFFTLHCSFYSSCLLSAEFTRQWQAQSFFRNSTNISQRQKTFIRVKPVDFFCLFYLFMIYQLSYTHTQSFCSV